MQIIQVLSKILEVIRIYKARFMPDNGTMRFDNITKGLLAMSIQNEMYDNILFAWFGEAGSKLRVASATESFYTKLYSLKGTNDATQTTELSQPNLRGNIAPNERWAMSNENGQSKYVTHPTISFAANEAWSVSTVFNWNGSLDYTVLYGRLNGNTEFYLDGNFGEGSNMYFSPDSGTGVYLSSSSAFRGKTKVLTLVGDNGTLKLYVNGVLLDTKTIQTDVAFTSLFGVVNYLSWPFNGKLYAHIIRSGAMTQSQVTAEYNFFRSIYPEIETVKIGTQDWATSNLDVVTTPQGNVIANVPDNANIEKVTNAADREFSSDTGFWTKGTGVTISGGTLNSDGSVGAYAPLVTINASVITKINTCYKLTITITSYTSGVLAIIIGNIGKADITAAGTYVFYAKTIDTEPFRIYSWSTAFIGSVDNVSVQEIGWAGSTELYDGIYAQTSGTVEQKTYAAVKAASMWSYYNNDASLGAIYGKLYNWYAAKLLQMDIDYYNTANPSTPWGYRVPTSTDFTTLQTTLGGASVAGGKMKKEGLLYWTTPNTGADNSSGLSALPCGYRLGDTGIFSAINSIGLIWTNTEYPMPTDGYYEELNYNNSAIAKSGYTKRGGFSVRMIKN